MTPSMQGGRRGDRKSSRKRFEESPDARENRNFKDEMKGVLAWSEESELPIPKSRNDTKSAYNTENADITKQSFDHKAYEDAIKQFATPKVSEPLDDLSDGEVEVADERESTIGDRFETETVSEADSAAKPPSESYIEGVSLPSQLNRKQTKEVGSLEDQLC